ncbi:MAG TPA: Txe/YoeB family addiction module toxin [Rhizomicrobium sp.]|jgi:toxin YoeB|nr:Txe/YoeB family addiction module toxin [Rhizomicrobium sp.]
MKIVWSAYAWDEYVDWQARDSDIAAKINDLIFDIRRNPFSGVGKPEPLKGDFAGFWARRITAEHRLVYRVVGKRGVDQAVEIAQCRYHYSKR